MTTLVLTAKRSWSWSAGLLQRRITWALGLALLVLAATWDSSEARALVVASLADAYIQVSAFVAATLALVYGLERLFKLDAGELLTRHARWQVPVAAFLGALPGCGGAIVVITQYVRGRIGFGAVLAVLTATMGDAAFLLLAQEPATGLAIFALSFGVGVVSGWTVDAVHGPEFLRRPPQPRSPAVGAGGDLPRFVQRLEWPWIALIVPGLVLAVLTAFQVDTDALLGTPLVPAPTTLLGVTGSLLAIVMWAASPAQSLAENVAAGTPDCAGGLCGHPGGSRTSRIIGDTNFVTAWVVLAFLAYELGTHLTGLDLKALFAGGGAVVPLIGVLVGLLPGCGPQVAVTTLYLQGVVPLSAQLGNAISNDGDALFPAIALAPRVAAVATLYSAVPALIVAYGTWWLWD